MHPAKNLYSGLVRCLLSPLVCTLALVGCAGSGIDPANTGSDVPLDQPSFPTGMALHTTERALVVVSSNYDLRYNTGALLVADLDKVAAMLADAPDPDIAVVDDAYDSAVLFPSFGNRPVITDDGGHMLTAIREDNLLAEVLIDAAGGSLDLSCGVDAEPGQAAPLCGQTPYAAALPGNDPFDLVLYEQTPTLISGVAALLRSPDLVFFFLRPERTGDDRIRLFRKTVGDDIIGTRAAVGLPGDRPLVLASADRIRLSSTRTAALIYWFDPAAGDDTVIRRFDLYAETGAESARALAASPDGDALFVLTRAPDAVVRLDLVRDGNDLDISLGGVGPSCREPIAARTIRQTNARGEVVDRLLVTCFSSDTVMALDPYTLSVTDQVADFGRGPYDIVVDDAGPTPVVYVSNFLDNSVSVLDLVDDEGEVRLAPKGRIGLPAPPPEDGR